MVEDDDFQAIVDDGVADFIGLAAADEVRGIGTGTLGRDGGNRVRTGGTRQQHQFLHAGGEVAVTEVNPD